MTFNKLGFSMQYNWLDLNVTPERVRVWMIYIICVISQPITFSPALHYLSLSFFLSLSLSLSVWIIVFNGCPVVNPVTSGANTRTHLQPNQNTHKSAKNNQLHMPQQCILKCIAQAIDLSKYIAQIITQGIKKMKFCNLFYLHCQYLYYYNLFAIVWLFLEHS